MHPEDLRCEYLREPLGIDVPAPRLSWIIQSDRRNWKQSAYRILVASSPEILARDTGDFWDSGRVESDETNQIPYAGKYLVSHTRCFWKVRVWTQDGKPSVWSEPTRWTTGIMDPTDWQARWIYKKEPSAHRQDIWWIWHPDELSGPKHFVKEITLTGPVENAEINIACDNRYELYVNDIKVGQGDSWRKAGCYQIAGVLKKGLNIITVAADYDGPGPAGLIVKGEIVLRDKTVIPVISDSDWRVSSLQGKFKEAKQVGSFGCAPWMGVLEKIIIGMLTPSPWLRKTFVLDDKPEYAPAYVNSLGYHELYVNGRKAGTGVLTPAVSDLRARSFYVAYDIAPLLRKGQNCVGIWLGRGWCVPGRPGVPPDGLPVRFQAEIFIGKQNITIAGDDTWKCAASPYATAGLCLQQGGERFDARLDNPRWCDAGYDDRTWTGVEIAAEPPPVPAESQMCPVNRIGKRIPAVSIRLLDDGCHELDFGTDLTGWLRLRLPVLEPGRRILIRYAESGGQTYSQIDEFISAGRYSEEFRSKFHYHGFRYAIIEGLPEKPALEDAEALLIESDLEPTGSFTCSNELFNRIYRLNLWTVRCLNLGGYMVDCPHRERLGYGGDGQVSAETCLMNLWMPAFYTKWLADWRHGQDPATGGLPYTAPTGGGGGGPAWGGFLAAAAWRMYLHYGDRRILDECYEPMRHYLDFLESHCAEDILRAYGGQWDFLGDWVAPGHGQTGGNWILPVRVNEAFNNCYRVYLWELLEKSAAALGKEDEARRCREKLDRIRPLIHREFYDPEKHTYVWEDQPYQCLPLMTDVTPPPERDAVLKKLEDGILVRRKGHLDAGMHGVYFMFQYLSAVRRDDLLFAIVNQRTYPSWGYMLENGATATWEEWDGVNSHIHACFNSAAGWFHNGLAGIRPDPSAPGFKKIIIRPAVVGDLTWVKAEYKSIHGLIASEWKKENGRFTLNVTIPPNTTATVYVPSADGNDSVYSIGSGSYSFAGS